MNLSNRLRLTQELFCSIHELSAKVDEVRPQVHAHDPRGELMQKATLDLIAKLAKLLAEVQA